MTLPIIHQRIESPTDEPSGFQVAELATTTHRFTLLAVEHSADTSWPKHDFDIEGVLLVEGYDGLEGMWTQAHFDIKCWAGCIRLSQARHEVDKLRDLDGRPQVWIEPGGHGIRGDPINGATRPYLDYVPVSMFSPQGYWTHRKELFVQDEHGRWMRGGAHAPWSWTGRIGMPGLVATDPVSFIEQSGVQGFSPLSRMYTKNPFWGIT